MQNKSQVDKPKRFAAIGCSVLLLLTACQERSWNNPYSAADAQANIYYSSFSEQPKTLDPAKSYSTDSNLFIAQIYEPPLQYDYLKRPYTLVPLTAAKMPQPVFLDAKGEKLSVDAPVKEIAQTVYDITIQPGIYYQPHPAFAKKPDGNYYYQHLSSAEIIHKESLTDFPQVGTRELTAEDYVYEIKRLADPRVQSPIFGFLSNYIAGFSDFNQQLEKIYQTQPGKIIDLRQIPLAGVQVIDKYTYRITTKGYYPQFIYWLAMPFFAPMPWEADMFYQQPGMSNNNLTLDWYPIGTGPYVLEENNPNRRMVLARNPHFHKEYYPYTSDADDKAAGLLSQAGKQLPFIDKFIFTLEKESIPRWNKFLQGYYDQSAIGSDSFEQAVNIDPDGNAEVTPFLKEKNIRLQTNVSTGVFYMGFNMLDPIIGGTSERARKLRQAIAIAMNYEEFIAIFLNGRGIPAQSPIPPEIFGYREGKAGINPYIFDWNDNHLEKKSIEVARNLMIEAGYPNGIDAKTGEALLLNFDVMSGGTADDKAFYAWMRKQFAQLGIQLQIRDTQYSRFQEKVRTGQAQMFFWGWSADYPDPENFLFLLYGPNAKVKHGGENASNYANPAYDVLFEQMRDLPNNDKRQTIINKMLDIMWYDAPAVWGFYPRGFLLTQSWVSPFKVNEMANNTLKYLSINPSERAKLRALWNQPVFWPLVVLLLLLLAGLTPIFYFYWRRKHRPIKEELK